MASNDHLLTIAGLALGVPGAGEVGARLCTLGWRKAQCLTNMDQVRKSQYEVAFEVCKQRLALSIELLVKAEITISQKQAATLSSIIQQLRSMCQRFENALNKTSGSNESEEQLKRILGDLRSWQEDFDALLLTLTVSGTFAQMAEQDPLTKAIKAVTHLKLLQAAKAAVTAPDFPPAPKISLDLREPMQEVSYTAISRPADYAQNRILVEYRELLPDSASEATLGRLAHVLRSMNPLDMNLLSCRGYDDGKLLFAVPPGFGEPISLRQLLIRESERPKHPLNERIDLLRQIATALLYLHGSGFIHHSVRPDCILLLSRPSNAEQIITSDDAEQHMASGDVGRADESKEEKVDGRRARDNVNAGQQSQPPAISDQSCRGPTSASPSILGQAFLMGFVLSRKEDGRSERKEDDCLEHNLYAPLTRQKPDGNKRYYSFVDDVYSFAVVALEIALWRSFFEQEALDPHHICFTRKFKGDTTSAEALQDYLIDQAKTQVPRRMGQKLADLIIGCLKCLTEPNSPDVPLELTSNWGQSAMVYILGVLQEITI